MRAAPARRGEAAEGALGLVSAAGAHGAGARQRAALRQRAQRSEAECPTRGTWTSTGPWARRSRRKRKATDGMRRRAAVGSRSRSSSPTARTGAGDAAGVVGAQADVAPAIRASRSACASVERPWPASNSAADSCAARSTATVLLCGCGVRGSEWASLPSSTTTISPRSLSGANEAARVPSMIRLAAARREIGAVARGLAGLEREAAPTAPAPKTSWKRGVVRCSSRTVGNTTSAERPERSAASTASTDAAEQVTRLSGDGGGLPQGAGERPPATASRTSSRG